MATALTYSNFIAAIKSVYNTAHNNGYRYGDSHATPPCADGFISCDRLIARALWNMGYTDQPVSTTTTSGITVFNVGTYLPKYGFIKTTSKAAIRPGAVICVGQSGNNISHVFVVTEYNASTDLCSKYDMGSNDRIRAAQPFTNVKLNQWSTRHFICAFNLPNNIGKNNTSTSTKTIQQMLKTIGFSITVDGDYGEKTTNIVSEFQKIYNLSISGSVDSTTLKALKTAYNYVTVDGFDYEYYVEKYPDLKAAIGVNKKKLIAHYYNYGKAEGRSIKAESTPSSTPASSKVTTDFSKYEGKISNAGSDENGKYSGGAAGDQTGNEWRVRSWYDRPWNVVLRYSNPDIADLIAQLAIEAANNNKIGYDQNQRTTYWTQLSKVGYRPSKITTACETDCSAGIAANVKAAGYLLNKEAFKNVNKDAYTGNLRTALINAGFKALTDKKYLSSYEYLRPGDILLYEGHHTATNLGVGSKSAYDGRHVPGVGKNNSSLKTIDIQKILTSAGWSLIAHGVYGKRTTAMVKSFQKVYNLTQTGNVGTAEEKILKTINKYIEDGFDAEFYANKYPDLKKAFGDSKRDLLAHYYFHGAKEGRIYKKEASKQNNELTNNTTGVYNKTIKRNGTITTLLNIRKGPGMAYANITKYPTLPANTKVGVCDMVIDKDNIKWYYIKYNNTYGFASAMYIKLS